MRALIVEDGRSRGALAAARALGAAGWTVGIASPERVGLAASSRWTERWHRVPPPEEGVDGFVNATRAAISAGEYELVFASGDAELLALSERRGELGAEMPYAPHEVVLRALDKLEVVRAAAEAGLHVPRTEPADDASLRTFALPVVVKARLHGDPAARGAPARLEALVARTREEAVARIEELRALGAQPLLQEHLIGRLAAHTVVVDRDGRVVARVQQRAEATWPPGVGASVRAETVPVDEELGAAVDRLVGRLGWFGLAELQLVEDAAGVPRLIDLNGRFYGSLALALAAGCNLPAVWAALATGRVPPAPCEARAGVRYQWLEGDLRRALCERDGLVTALRFAPGAAHSIVSLRDPAPGARYALHLAGRALRKVLP
jgi:predicted ATP-grasp superfamily ATP-dependent carboligase